LDMDYYYFEFTLGVNITRNRSNKLFVTNFGEFLHFMQQGNMAIQAGVG